MPAPKNLIGETFSRLKVVGKVLVPKNGRDRVYWDCLCECGEKALVRTDSLTKGLVKSCGCLKKEQDMKNLTANHSHKSSKTRLYQIWSGMKKRCYNPGDSSYERYGARGIKVCESWREDFGSFKVWALANAYSDDLTIERIDNEKCYTPENCKWAGNKEQSRNRRSNIKVDFQGEQITLMELSEITGVGYKVLNARYDRGDRNERLLRPLNTDKKVHRGSLQHLSKLTEGQVVAIRNSIQCGALQKDLAFEYGVSLSVINSIAKRRTWKHI
ncbi:hypothetical protein [Paenibacillus brasilensis]|uniref:Uncharacterized protein n=1 Tax=Paenibacillus brasilensis TaxID=128574 RepID=A0ABU0KTK2_9BACL|nr:hypothetical protein [Paenibacillus brasilensis]MDQ0492767.1 hypothetical protein [Paenibacillus brasilensis]